MDAIKEGFDTYFIEDATRAIDPKGFETAKKDIVSHGGKIITSSDVIHRVSVL
jgi:nicotinamidase/pyrazinamidase